MSTQNDQTTEDQFSLEQSRADSLRQNTIQAKIKRDQAQLAQTKKAAKTKKKISAAEKKHSQKLMGAWFLVLFTAGGSTLYINYHIFARMAFSKNYCKLGHEWYFMNNLSKQIARQLEIIALIFLNILTTIYIVAAISILVWMIQNPWKAGGITAMYAAAKIYIFK